MTLICLAFASAFSAFELAFNVVGDKYLRFRQTCCTQGQFFTWWMDCVLCCLLCYVLFLVLLCVVCCLRNCLLYCLLFCALCCVLCFKLCCLQCCLLSCLLSGALWYLSLCVLCVYCCCAQPSRHSGILEKQSTRKVLLHITKKA